MRKARLLIIAITLIFPPFSLAQRPVKPARQLKNQIITSTTKCPQYTLKPHSLKETIKIGMKRGREVQRIESEYKLARYHFRQNKAEYTTEVMLSANDDGGKSSVFSKTLKNSGNLSLPI